MNGGNLQKTGNIFEKQAYAGVVQDKAPQARYTAGRGEPYTADREAVDRAKQHGSEKRQTAHLSSRVRPHIKTELLRIAKTRGEDWNESR